MGRRRMGLILWILLIIDDVGEVKVPSCFATWEMSGRGGAMRFSFFLPVGRFGLSPAGVLRFCYRAFRGVEV